jgi:imidazolonepropionase-like amidohydrolase
VRITSDEMSVEQSQEVTPELRVGGTLDAFSIDWDRQLRSGVTTVLVNPPDLNVIGGLGIALKTAGPESIAARTVKDNAVLRGAIGSQPSVRNRPAFQRPTSFYNRRPTTRMGVEWEWRKTFYDVALGPDEGEEPRQGRETIIAALKGEIPIAIQAWTTQDIRTAVFLREEVENGEEFKAGGLNKPRFIIDAAAEAWKEPQLLVRSKTAVVLPPFPSSGRTRDNAFMAWDVAADLQKAGVTFALSSHGLEGYDQRLPMQAGYAMSGGLGFADALAAVTITPARMIGIDGRVGSLEPGKDADLVLWSGEPFEPSSRVLAVIVDGVLRYDARDASEKK